MQLRGQKVVVTGGAGFIGSHIVERLVAVGADVIVIDDLSVGDWANLDAVPDVRRVEGDVRDAELLDLVLPGTALVIHAACDNLRASLGRPLFTHDVNATGTLVTALAAVRHDVPRFAYISSSESYGSARSTPMDESHPLDPTTVYGAAKAAGELYSQACWRTYGLPVVVIRPFNSYGPREHSTGTSAEVIPKFVARIRAGERPVIFGSGEQTRDFTWVEETAQGIVAAASCDALVGEAVNIAYGREVAIKRVCALLLELLDAQHLEPEFSDERPGDVAAHFADTTKAKRVLGFEPSIAIEEGLRRYVEWVLTTDAGLTGEPHVVRNW